MINLPLKTSLLLAGLILSVHCGPMVHLDAPVMILTYHAIETNPSETLTRDTSDFIGDLDYLQSKYKFMTLEELALKIENDEKILTPTIILNFDDGRIEHYEIAYQELKNRGIKANFFVPTATVDQEGHMTWDQIVEMHNAGYSMQSHSFDHIHLADKLDGETELEYEERVRFQLQQSLDDFKSHGMVTIIIATPFGSQNETVIGLAYDVGYDLVRGTQNEVNTMFPQGYVLNLYYQSMMGSSDIHEIQLEDL